MKRYYINLFAIFVLLFWGCSTHESHIVNDVIEYDATPKSKILFKHPTIYSSLLFTDYPTLTILNSVDYTNSCKRRQLTFQRNWGKNIVTLDSITQYSIEQTDTFEIISSSNNLSPSILIHHQDKLMPPMQRMQNTGGGMLLHTLTLLYLFKM